ncbi:NPCBM/NEW2 domain protein OS=Lysinibacillus sphaericus OX=1421 GN=LS41612_04930 PE=4 SV=1 [Lysinibacillus sphaericus]
MKGKAVNVTLASNQATKTNTLYLSVDKEKQDDFLGYEIFRDNELIGFTIDKYR